jgi:hypothetical protein
MSADPVSWLVVEPGWKVVTADGQEVGRVDEIVGDTGKDIFSGLSVSQGLLRKPRFVPAELVGDILDGEIQLDVDSDRFARLDDYDTPEESTEILPPDPRR